MAVSLWISDFLIPALPSALAAGAVLAAMVRIAVGRPALGMICFFVFFAFAWRLVSVLYIDVFGPLFSEQLERYIGPGISTVPIAISQGIVIATLLFSFRPQRLQALWSQSGAGLESELPVGRFKLSDLAFWTVGLFLVALWLELLARGPIPLFAGMERFDYAQQYGGPLLHRLLEWGPMLAFQLGVFFAVPTLRAGSFDRRFAGLFAVLILYLFLVGHRFSSFYAYSSFFIIPIGAVLSGRHRDNPAGRKLVSRTGFRNFGIAAAALLVLIAGAVTYSYTVVRGFDGAELLTKLSQRTLVQQGEMWWMTYERVFLQGDWNGNLAAHKLFVDPFDPARNSTMQFLMELGLPIERAHFILEQGSAYTGGWPEVVFELGGPIGGFFLVALSAFIFSEFAFLVTRSIIQERFATCFFLTPILFALSINLVSGMANSFFQVTFVIKVAIALIVYVTEDRWRSEMLSLGRRCNPLAVIREDA